MFNINHLQIAGRTGTGLDLQSCAVLRRGQVPLGATVTAWTLPPAGPGPNGIKRDQTSGD